LGCCFLPINELQLQAYTRASRSSPCVPACAADGSGTRSHEQRPGLVQVGWIEVGQLYQPVEIHDLHPS
jgi:hypothetical protein